MLRASRHKAVLLTTALSVTFSLFGVTLTSAAAAPELDPLVQEVRTQALAVKGLVENRFALEVELAPLEVEETARLAALAPALSPSGIPLRLNQSQPPTLSPSGIPLRLNPSQAQAAPASGIPVSPTLEAPASSVLPPREGTDAPSSIPQRRVVAEVEADFASFASEAPAITPDGLAVIPEVLPDNLPPTALPEVPEAPAALSSSGIPVRVSAAPPTPSLEITASGLPSRTQPVAPAPRTLQQVRAYVQQARSAEYHAMVKLLTAVREATGAEFDVLKVTGEWRLLEAARLTVMLDGLQFLGAPYVFATTGPEVFDCSGFTLTVWGKVGVSLTHWAAAQQASIAPRDAATAVAADLVFFAGGPTAGGPLNIGHVALVLSEGFMLQSSPSNGVWVDDLDDRNPPVAYGSPLDQQPAQPPAQ